MKEGLRPTRRLIHQRPFAWQDKAVLRYMRNHLKGDLGFTDERVRLLMCVYHALTEIDSNQVGKGLINAGYHSIAKHAVVSYSTARRYTAELVELGFIIKINRPRGLRWWTNQWIICDWREIDATYVLDAEHTSAPNSFTEMFSERAGKEEQYD